MNTEPRTEAGRTLLNDPHYAGSYFEDGGRIRLTEHILAIEAEAALPVPALDALRAAVADWLKEYDSDGGASFAAIDRVRAALGSQEEPRGSLKAPGVNLDGASFDAPDGTRWRITSDEPGLGEGNVR